MKEYVAVIFSYGNKEHTGGSLISRRWKNRKRPSVPEYCVMKILKAFVATAKLINLILTF